MQMFSDHAGQEATDTMRLRIHVLAERLVAHPDVRCWFSFFCNPAQYDMQVHDILSRERDYDQECPVRLLNMHLESHPLIKFSLYVFSI